MTTTAETLPTLFPLPRNLAAVNGCKVLLGQSTEGDVYLDVRDTPHTLLMGAAGSGKTVATNGVLSQWLNAGNEAVVLSVRPFDYREFDEAAGVRAVTRDVVAGAEALAVVRDELDARLSALTAAGAATYEDLPEGERPARLLVVVDDAAELMHLERLTEGELHRCPPSALLLLLRLRGRGRGHTLGDVPERGRTEAQARNDAAVQVRAHVATLVRLGHLVGIHVWAITQRADVADGLHASTKSGLDARILLGAADGTARLMAGFPDTPDTHVTPGIRGRGLYGAAGTQPAEVQFAHLPHA